MNVTDLTQLRQLLTTETFGTDGSFSTATIESLVKYYALVLKWNSLLHLTTLTSPAEFAQRHLAEAGWLTAQLLPQVSHVFDFGSGLGVPGIPLALLRPDLAVTLVESNHKKAIFLDEVADRLQLGNVKVKACRLESIDPLPENAALAARAIDRMTTLLPLILKLGGAAAQILLLGGADLRESVEQNIPAAFSFQQMQLPDSAARYLLELRRST